MNSLRLRLNPSPEQAARLDALQAAFAEVCCALGPVVQQTRCWNRVTLHHLTYRALRERFPNLGSQMICNAIYSVSRTCRMVFQHPNSPWNIAKLGDRPLPQLRFLASSPVYFDRHTLSLKNGQLSMFTLDGRMRFELELKAEDEARFHAEKLREIVLAKGAAGFELTFHFSPQEDEANVAADAAADLPEYVLIKDDDSAVPVSPSSLAAQRSDAFAPRP